MRIRNPTRVHIRDKKIRQMYSLQCTLYSVQSTAHMHRKFQTQREWPKEKIRKLQHTYKKNMYLDKEEGQRVGSLL
jgi:hypothetical protein